MSAHRNARALLAAPCASLLLLACRDDRASAPSAAAVVRADPIVRTSDIIAGAPPPAPERVAPFDGDAAAEREGRQLFISFNCSGCHGAAGGGGMGPPLADAKWIYGRQPQNVFQSVVEGRPNGMPSFGGKIPEGALWKIVAYVRTLDAEARKASGGEGDPGGESSGGGVP